MSIHDDFDSDLKPAPPSSVDLISPEFGEIAGFGLPALCRFWVLGAWEVSRPRTIPFLGREHISFAEQLCSTVIDMVISCTLMYIFVHWKGWLGWSISAIMSLDIDLMWRDGDERRENRQLAAVYIMYARVYLYIGEILPPVIDYMGYMRSMMATDSDIWVICGVYVICSKLNKNKRNETKIFKIKLIQFTIIGPILI